MGQRSGPGAGFGDATHAVCLRFLGSCRCSGKSGHSLFRLLDAEGFESRRDCTLKGFLENSGEKFPPSSKQDPFIPSNAVPNTCSIRSTLA